jgi:hypothetical protein
MGIDEGISSSWPERASLGPVGKTLEAQVKTRTLRKNGEACGTRGAKRTRPAATSYGVAGFGGGAGGTTGSLNFDGSIGTLG